MVQVEPQRTQRSQRSQRKNAGARHTETFKEGTESDVCGNVLIRTTSDSYVGCGTILDAVCEENWLWREGPRASFGAFPYRGTCAHVQPAGEAGNSVQKQHHQLKPQGAAIMLRVTVRMSDAIRQWELDEWTALVVLAVLSAEPVTLSELLAAIRRYQPDHDLVKLATISLRFMRLFAVTIGVSSI